MNSDTIILTFIIVILSYFALNMVTDSIDNVNSSSFVINDDREYVNNISVDCENCSDLYVSRTGDNVTGDYNFNNNTYIDNNGSIVAGYVYTNGTYITDVGGGEEEDTLQSVTDRNATTTNNITTPYIIADGSQLDNVNYTEIDTLQTVTDRGSLTTNTITAYNYITAAGTNGAFPHARIIAKSYPSGTYTANYYWFPNGGSQAGNNWEMKGQSQYGRLKLRTGMNTAFSGGTDRFFFTVAGDMWISRDLDIDRDLNVDNNAHIADTLTVGNDIIVTDAVFANSFHGGGSQLTGFIKKELIAEGNFSGVQINITGLNLTKYSKVYGYLDLNCSINTTTTYNINLRINDDFNNNYDEYYVVNEYKNGAVLQSFTHNFARTYTRLGWLQPSNIYGNTILSSTEFTMNPQIDSTRLIQSHFNEIQYNPAKTIYATGIMFIDSNYLISNTDITEILLFWGVSLKGRYRLEGEY